MLRHLFRADAASRYLPFVLGVAALLTTMALAALLAVNRSLDRWQAAAPGIVTIQVAAGGDAAADAKQARALQLKLRNDPAVVEVDLLAERAVADLLAPWLGNPADARELPLPQVLHVRLRDGDPGAAARLARTAAAIAPGAVVDDHRVWRTRLLDYTGLLRTGLVVQLLLMLAAAGIAAAGATLARLAIHRETVELLHLLGADDRFIVRGLVRQATVAAGIAAATGFGLAALFLLVLDRAAVGMDDTFLPVLRLADGDWLWLAAAPVGVVALTATMSVLTARRRLRQRM
jgi:cell division transport system permease protein